MTEREQVIAELLYLKHDCLEGSATDQTLDKAISLLKAQEPKPVHVTANINRRKIGVCPNCGVILNSGDYPNYCGKCGQEVKWDE